ncbi:leucine-rich repeat domain-containing protein [Wolbachia endosymbiont (group A) of Lasioglossum fulvicorne]|uniref:leucine-rich repeat domain-containing protein n=1 Tax=Wolbachia endosymbiont (group A) of Lasioglossum fulvicorne TaxID=3066201 RepID=UPI003341A3E7
MDFNQYVRGRAFVLQDRTPINISELVRFLQSNTHITMLSLWNNKIGDEGAKALANLSNLETLELRSNEMSDEGAKALAKLSKLERLDLSFNNISDEGTKALAKLSNLSSLELLGNKIGDEGAKALAKLSKLKRLDLDGNKIGDEGAKALANGKLSKLKLLNLRGNKIDDEGAKALAKLSNLRHLDLPHNEIGDEGAKALAKLTNLEWLDLNNNKIGDKGAKALANGKLTSLERLVLSQNEIGGEGAKALVKLTNLKQLDLDGNKIGDEGAKALANERFTNLKLNLCRNNIGDEGAKALAESPFLEHVRISLENNPISSKGIKALAESENYFELTSNFDYANDNSSLGFYKCLRKLWSEKRIWSKGSVNKLGKDTTKSLFFHLAQQNHPKERIELLLDDSDKYPFLINSIDWQGHTLSHFYTHSPEMQKFFFERGMIPEEERSRRDDERIARDSQSVHGSLVVKRTNFFAKKLVESRGDSKEQLEQAAASYVESIRLFKQYQNDPIRLKLLSLTDNDKRSVMERTLRNSDSIPNDKEFIKAVIDKAEQALKQQYLKKNFRGEYDQRYPTNRMQYDYARDDAKITIPESIGYIKLLIDNFSVPLKEKKELLVTLMEQNPDLVKNKLSKSLFIIFSEVRQ